MGISFETLIDWRDFSASSHVAINLRLGKNTFYIIILHARKIAYTLFSLGLNS